MWDLGSGRAEGEVFVIVFCERVRIPVERVDVLTGECCAAGWQRQRDNQMSAL